MKVRLLLIIGSFLMWSACKERPTYNPFDDQFNVSVKFLLDDDCESIPAGCGYFNLTYPTGNLRPYYQIYIDDHDEVVAKGFGWELDTIEAADKNDVFDMPLDSSLLNDEFSKYGYFYMDRLENLIWLLNRLEGDTIQVKINSHKISDHEFVRSLSYFKSNITAN